VSCHSNLFIILSSTLSAEIHTTSAQHVRPSGIRCRWPDDLQRSVRWAARPHRQHDNFQTTFKTHFFRAIYTSSALEVKT